MKTRLANPIYDVVFKSMMENEQVAKILLSALLKKEIVDVKPGKNEFPNTHTPNLSIFKIDFSARVKDEDGTEQQITIEIQKTWGSYEVLRFRQYLAKQYLAPENVQILEDGAMPYGIPLVTIYLLGHLIGDIPEPVIYVRRNYFDYDDNIIDYKDDFIESLSHDSIIVQIPLLKGKARNYLERILQVFDQEYIKKDDSHILEIEESNLEKEADLQPIIRCLTKLVSSSEVREIMEVEDIYLGEKAFDDNQRLKAQQKIDEKSKIIEEKSQIIEEKSQLLEEKSQVIKSAILILSKNGLSTEAIAKELSLNVDEVEKILLTS